jgi:hypothetical protein
MKVSLKNFFDIKRNNTQADFLDSFAKAQLAIETIIHQEKHLDDERMLEHFHRRRF